MLSQHESLLRLLDNCVAWYLLFVILPYILFRISLCERAFDFSPIGLRSASVWSVVFDLEACGAMSLVTSFRFLFCIYAHIVYVSIRCFFYYCLLPFPFRLCVFTILRFNRNLLKCIGSYGIGFIFCFGSWLPTVGMNYWHRIVAQKAHLQQNRWPYISEQDLLK